ncbi:MAG: GDSL-type esterase/lipase family protein [Prevotellaceae bacterium]|nr:GDSL-type esterase/lipase family protein [Prevotellaceae bacterium]
MFSFILNGQTNNDNWANLSRYAEANKQLKNSADTRVKVVFLGNSITEGWANIHPDFFKSNGYVGRGISGQTSPQFLSRFRNDVVELNPQAVVINGGINDIAENSGTYDPDFTFGNIKSMAEIAAANGIAVVLTSVLPAGNIPWRKNIKDVPSKILELNAKIKAYAQEKSFAYVDYYSSMVNEHKAMIAEYTGDGVHVTDLGYRLMENIVKQTLSKLNL